MTNFTWSVPTPANLPPDHSATFYAWKALTEPQAAVGSDRGYTQALIDAVLTNKPTGGGPKQLTGRPGLRGLGGSRPTKLMSSFGAAVATTAGKIVLCTTVAAASVGGVYATTDRIGLPQPARAPEVAAVDLTEGTPPEVPAAPDTPATPETLAAPATPDIGAPIQVANDHGQEIVAFITDTDLHGCEFGQAVADMASNGAGHQPVDPCVQSDKTGSDGKSGEGNSGNAGGGSEEGQGRGPAEGNRPEQAGKKK